MPYEGYYREITTLLNCRVPCPTVTIKRRTDHKQLITLAVTVQLATPTFSLEDLARPKRGLEGAGFAASGFCMAAGGLSERVR